MSINCYRVRTFSCPEPLEKQKTKPLEIDPVVIIKPIKDAAWITNILNKYFSKEEE